MELGCAEREDHRRADTGPSAVFGVGDTRLELASRWWPKIAFSSLISQRCLGGTAKNVQFRAHRSAKKNNFFTLCLETYLAWKFLFFVTFTKRHRAWTVTMCASNTSWFDRCFQMTLYRRTCISLLLIPFSSVEKIFRRKEKYQTSKNTQSQTVGHVSRTFSCPSLQESTGQIMLKLNNTGIFMHALKTEWHKKCYLLNVGKDQQLGWTVTKKVLVGWKKKIKNYKWRRAWCLAVTEEFVNVQWRTSAHKGLVLKPWCTEPPWFPGSNSTDKHGRHETKSHWRPWHTLCSLQDA